MNTFHINFLPILTVVQKDIPLFINGEQNGTVTLRRITETGEFSITPFIKPIVPNISNVYFFERTVSSVAQDPFVCLLDVYIEPFSLNLNEGQTIENFIANGEPNPLDLGFTFLDLMRWKEHRETSSFTRRKASTTITEAQYNSISRVRMVPWTSDFVCAAPPPPPPAPPPPDLFPPIVEF
jgi:hypothetical protein